MKAGCRCRSMGSRSPLQHGAMPASTWGQGYARKTLTLPYMMQPSGADARAIGLLRHSPVTQPPVLQSAEPCAHAIVLQLRLLRLVETQAREVTAAAPVMAAVFREGGRRVVGAPPLGPAVRPAPLLLPLEPPAGARRSHGAGTRLAGVLKAVAQATRREGAAAAGAERAWATELLSQSCAESARHRAAAPAPQVPSKLKFK